MRLLHDAVRHASLTFLATVIGVVMTAAPCAEAGVIGPMLASTLRSRRLHEQVPVIITLADAVDVSVFRDRDRRRRRARIVETLRRRAQVSQGPVKAFLRSRGIGETVDLWITNGIAARVSADTVAELARLPGVETIDLDATLTVPVTEPATSQTAEWNVNAIRVPEVWGLGYRGDGVVVANMDTGVDADHPDLAAKWRGGANSWYDPNGQHATPTDVDGHGTATMGLMVGGSAGGTAIGVAPDARWIAVKIFNDAGTASLSGIHQGFEWLLDPDGDPTTDDAPDIVNNSWGFVGNFDQCIREFEPDVHALVAANIAVVFSAGNEGPDLATSLSPGNYSESFAVGAVNATNTVASFSSRGPSACDGRTYPQVVAPGVSVRVARPSSGGTLSNPYTYVSGTSFSAPHVAGTMALLWSAFPDTSVADLEWAVERSAADLGNPGLDDVYGHGLVDALASYDRLATQADSPVSGDDAYVAGGVETLVVAAPGVLVNDTDPNGDLLTAKLVRGPSGGVLTLNGDGSFTYTSSSGTSADSFVYVANDGSADGNEAVVTIATTAPVAKLDRRVAAGKDDAEEKKSSGSVSLGSSDLELSVDGGSNQAVGMRFTRVDLPPGACITRAYVQFQVDEASSGPTSLVLRGGAIADAPAFTTARSNVSSRIPTVASVGWVVAPWPTVGEAGPAQRTADISPLIREILAQPGWASGNSLVIIVTGDGARVAESYEGLRSAAPLLHVECSRVDQVPVPTPTATPASTVTPAATASATATPAPLPTPTRTSTATPASTAPPTVVATATDTPRPTGTATPTATVTSASAATPTPAGLVQKATAMYVGDNFSANPTSFTTNLPAGTNLVIVGTAIESRVGARCPTAVTIGGAAASKIVDRDSGPAVDWHSCASLWYRNDPAIGPAVPIAVTWGATPTEGQVFVLAVSGADTSHAPAPAQGFAGAVDPPGKQMRGDMAGVTTVADSWCVASTSVSNAGTIASCTGYADQTQLQQSTTTSQTGAFIRRTIASAGAVSMCVTQSNINRWAIAEACFAPAR